MSNVQIENLIIYLSMFVWFIVLPMLTGVMAKRKNRSFGRWFIFSLFSSFLVPGLIPGSIVGMLMLYILPVVERKDVPSEKLKSFFGQEIKPAAFLVYLLVLSFSCFSLLMFAIKFNKSLPWLSRLIQRSEIIVPALNSNVMNYHLITFNLSIYMFFALLVYQAIILAKKQFNRHLDLYLQLSVTVIWMFSLISGSIWSNEAWSSYWSWDPRETWCLITAGTFMQAGMLHFTGRINENSKRGYLVVFSFNIMAFLILLFTKFGPGLFFSSLHMGL